MSDKDSEKRIVARVPRRPKTSTHGNAKVGKPRRVVTSSMRSKYGYGGGGLFGGFGSGGYGGGIAGTVTGSGGNFYSPELSTDFLELAQSLDEMRQYFRFFYDNDPFVGQAIDVHTEIPLSKVRFSKPRAKSKELAEKSQRFCMRWASSVQGGRSSERGLQSRLLEVTHEYHKIGEVNIWCEDPSPDEPEDLRSELHRWVDEEGPHEKKIEREDADERHVEWLKENYTGWSKIMILPPEQVQKETFPFSDEFIPELIIDSKTKNIVEASDAGDPQAKKVVDSMPKEIVEASRTSGSVPLNTDPDAGSFLAFLARKRSPYENHGRSILQRCLRVLVYRDKLRQAQTSIASRNMTPTRVIWAEDMDVGDIEALREQVDYSLMDPDYSIITNYQVNWEEMQSNGRLLDLNSEYDQTDRQLYAGLGVTEGLLSGESSYSADRINLEVINTRYMLLRDILANFVEEMLLKPMCKRMGFVEEDEDGHEVVIYPNLSFTRLGLWDNDSIFDKLFNLYQKGSLDIRTILELLNVDADLVQERLEKDMFTLADATFNEVFRGLYSRIGDSLAENSDAAEKVSRYLNLSYQKPEEGMGGRF